MKFRVLADFAGSQDGCTVTRFVAGEVVDLTEHLAPHVGRWAVPLEEAAPAIENKAVITTGRQRRIPGAPAVAKPAEPSADALVRE